MFVDYAAKNGKMSKEAVAQLLEVKGLKKLVDEIAANIPLYYTDQQDILSETDLLKRYEKLAFKLVNEKCAECVDYFGFLCRSAFKFFAFFFSSASVGSFPFRKSVLRPHASSDSEPWLKRAFEEPHER